MEHWPYWLLIVFVWGELYGYLKRRLGRLEGWHEGWDERAAVALRDARAVEEERAATCAHCGEPTTHVGRVCYGCAHTTTGEG